MSNNTSLNNWVINATILDVWHKLDAISFWNYWLQNQSVVTSEDWFQLRDFPATRINLTEVPQWNWQILNDTFFWWREISLEWYLKADNRADLDVLIDEFKLQMSMQNKYLRWKVGWESREVLATVSDLTFWVKNNIYIKFEITFKSQDAFFSKYKQQAFLLEWISDNTRVEDIRNEWKVASPLVIIAFKEDIVWTDTIKVKVRWVWIEISQSISDWDLLVIDGQKMTVKHNWTELDFDWVFPEFENGSNNTTIEINWTYTADFNFIYKYYLI